LTTRRQVCSGIAHDMKREPTWTGKEPGNDQKRERERERKKCGQP